MSDVQGPWEQAENSDYDEQKPAGGDSHEDEFDEEYGEQRPHGDPDRPDNSLEDAYQADIEYWEEVARLNALAKPYDPDVKATSEAAALNSLARPYDPDASVTSDAATVDPFADELADSSSVSLSSRLSSPDPDDFDWAEHADPVGPPAPDSAVARPDVSADMSFDPFGDSSSLSAPAQMGSLDQPVVDDYYQPAIVDPGVPYAEAVADDDAASMSSEFDPADQFVVDESYQTVADNPSFAPEVEFQQDISEQTDWNNFIG
ncbi:hypothetical protein ABGB19_10530 [Mycobacterium sp. B14F4]|uniref:hypothetical protein n=1 Tax=Mycobacterium sp. B14F4 TaxID=3153565 RepID=UPI00325F3678